MCLYLFLSFSYILYSNFFYIFFFFLMIRGPPRSTLFPCTTRFRSLNSTNEPITDHADLRLTLSDDESAKSVLFAVTGDRKSTRLKSSHVEISYAVFCLKKKKKKKIKQTKRKKKKLDWKTVK